MPEQFDVMVIIAHPDDAEFGAAGTIAMWVREGKTAIYLVCTDGDKGSSDRSMNGAQLAEIRRREQREAADQLGVNEVAFLGLPDQGLEESADFRHTIVREIRRYRPTVVVSSDPYRRYLWHRDHRVVGQVVMDALFPYARDHMAYPDLLEQGFEPHKVKEAYFFGAEDVNHRVDIGATFSQKLAALRCHASQIKQLQVGDLESWLKQRCERLAEGESFELAEAFHYVKLPD